MSNLFNLDSPFFRFLASVFDYMVLNVLALLLSLPVFTAGASLTALYRVVLDAIQEKDSVSPKAFWAYWNASLRTATAPWLLFLVLAALFLGDLWIIGFMPEGVRTFMAGGVILLFLLLLCVSLFSFPSFPPIPPGNSVSCSRRPLSAPLGFFPALSAWPFCGCFLALCFSFCPKSSLP